MKHKLMTSTIASLMFVAGAAVAADPTPVSVSGGTIHFEGKLVNAACAVSTKSADQTVTLGQYRTASFTAIDDTTAQVPFSIVLNDCDPKVAATAAVAFLVRQITPTLICWLSPLRTIALPQPASGLRFLITPPHR